MGNGRNIRMECWIEPKGRKYIVGYHLLLFTKNFDDKYVKKIMNTTTKLGTDSTYTAPKRAVQKTAEATDDLIGNKIKFLQQTNRKIRKRRRGKEEERKEKEEDNVTNDK